MRILVTGASGFVGSAAAAHFAQNHEVLGSVRRARPVAPGVRDVAVGDLGPETDWRPALGNVEAVVHTAARVHVMKERASDPLAEFRRVNVEGTLKLARQAAAQGVRRFVFISSIKVNGEETAPGALFRASDAPRPVDPYGVSKLEAEQRLLALAAETGLEVCVIRPPLIYGPGVRANFRAMLRLVQLGVPLPFGGIDNRRSLLGVDNLVDLIEHCVSSPQAAGRVFLASDADDVSTPELLRRIAIAMGRSSRVFTVSPGFLSALAACTGQRARAARLLGSLQVDISPTLQTLGWRPPVSMESGLRRTMEHFAREPKR